MKEEKVSFKKMRSVFFFALVLILTLAFLYLIRPFAYPLFWAAVFAVMFYPGYQRLNLTLKRPTLSAMLMVLLVIIVILIPVTLIGLLLVNQSLELYRSVSQWPVLDIGSITERLQSTVVGPYLETAQQEWRGYAEAATRGLSSFLFEQLKAITQNSFTFLLMLFLMLYTLYYFLKDGVRMVERVMHLSPLGNQYEMMLFNRFTSTVRATLKSTFIIGGVQGVLGGILFWITGVNGAFVWGVLMGAFSILPAMGPFVIWVPAGIAMLLLGYVWQGITILLVGAFVISIVDNLIRPPLVGKDTQMHPLIVLFSTLGGILLYGISGFVIGPIIAALFLSVLTIYDFYYEKELDDN